MTRQRTNNMPVDVMSAPRGPQPTAILAAALDIAEQFYSGARRTGE